MIQSLKKFIGTHKIETSLLGIILLIASFMRLYRISDYMTFLGDEGRDVMVAKQILEGNLTLLGPRASAGDFFLGPIYYYMMAPFLWLSNFDPVGPAIMIALIGVATVFLVYFVARKWFGVKAALMAGALYVVSPLVIAYSRSSWNPNPMPFVSLLTLYLLYQGIKLISYKRLLVVGLLLGIAIQLHYLTLFLGVIVFLFTLIGTFVASRKKVAARLLKEYGVMFVGFVAGISPFLLFEARHGFPNTKTIVGFIFVDNAEKTYPPQESFSSHITDAAFRIFARLVTSFPPPERVELLNDQNVLIWQIATIILALAAVISMFFIKDRLVQLLLVVWLVVGIILFGFYRREIYDYYFGFMFPLPFLLVGNFLGRIWENKKLKIGIVISLLIFIILMVVNLYGIPFKSEPNRQKEQARTIADFVLEKTDGKPYNFALLAQGNSDHVYRYFFEIEGKPPVTIESEMVDPERKTVTDQLLIICELGDCQPLGNSLWEVAGFGRADIAGEWNVSVFKVYKLVPYQGEEN